MKKVKNNIYLVAKKAENNSGNLDYFILMPTGEREYLFTKKYSAVCYEKCKSPVQLSKIMYEKERNKGVMNLVKHLQFMMPYMAEILDIGVVSKTRKKHVA